MGNKILFIYTFFILSVANIIIRLDCFLSIVVLEGYNDPLSLVIQELSYQLEPC